MTSPTDASTRSSDELSVLCGELAAVIRLRWGRGPVKTSAHWAGRDVLVVLMENGHTDAERTLRASGHADELVDGRRLMQSVVEDDLKEIAERVLDRKVVTILSATRLDPDLSAEIFLLEPDGRVTDIHDSLAARAARAKSRSEHLADESRAVGAQHRQILRRRRRTEGPDD